VKMCQNTVTDNYQVNWNLKSEVFALDTRYSNSRTHTQMRIYRSPFSGLNPLFSRYKHLFWEQHFVQRIGICKGAGVQFEIPQKMWNHPNMFRTPFHKSWIRLREIFNMQNTPETTFLHCTIYTRYSNQRTPNTILHSVLNTQSTSDK
jgi:hypothetical protein